MNNPEGGYKSLPFFKQSEIIHDYTVLFCQRHIDNNYKDYKSYKGYSRQSDQLIQAARSGKQNIAEGYLEKGYELRLKFFGFARASLEELLTDFLDFLRQRGLKIWDKDSPEARAVRQLVYKNYNIYKDYNGYKEYKLYKPDLKDYLPYLENPETAANAMICLINQTNQLLDQKARWTEEKFVKEGGFRENLLKKRLEYRRQQEEGPKTPSK